MFSDEPPSALQQQFVELVQVFGVLRSETTPCGQKMSVSDAHALVELRLQGELPQSEIGAQLGLAKSTVSRLVDQLESRGWVVRSATQDGDGRVRLVGLTPKGEARADEVLSARRERFGRIVAQIEPTDREAVVDALEILNKAVRHAK